MNENVISYETRLSPKKLFCPKIKNELVYAQVIDLVNLKPHLKGKLVTEMTYRCH
jgi:hypothetical protein